jgi:adenylylsulfate kinase-like enzyme
MTITAVADETTTERPESRHPSAAAFIITGIPGVGKTTIARALAARFPIAAHVEADRLHEMILSGGLWPHHEPRGEAMRQLRLRARNAALLATSFSRSGIVPIVDDVIVGRDRLAIYRRGIASRPLTLVVLSPSLEVALERDRHREYKHVGDKWSHLDARQRLELANFGLWIDSSGLTPEQTVEAILAEAPQEGNL